MFDCIQVFKSHTIRDQRCDVKKAMSKEEMAAVRAGGDLRGGMCIFDLRLFEFISVE